jgi:hypothetical protein
MDAVIFSMPPALSLSKGWMAEPRKGVKHNSEFPGGDSGWGDR